MTYPPFCLVCGRRFNSVRVSWAAGDQVIRCGHCGAHTPHIETLDIEEHQRLQKLIAIQEAPTIEVQGDVL